MKTTDKRPQAGYNQALGARGEALAETYLIGQGMRLLERNWRCNQGELDLIMRDEETVVAVEVKTRNGSKLGTPLNAITAHKVARLRRLLYEWSRATPLHYSGLRLDAVAITLLPGDSRALIDHLRGIS